MSKQSNQRYRKEMDKKNFDQNNSGSSASTNSNNKSGMADASTSGMNSISNRTGSKNK